MEVSNLFSFFFVAYRPTVAAARMQSCYEYNNGDSNISFGLKSMAQRSLSCGILSQNYCIANDTSKKLF